LAHEIRATRWIETSEPHPGNDLPDPARIDGEAVILGDEVDVLLVEQVVDLERHVVVDALRPELEPVAGDGVDLPVVGAGLRGRAARC
jgi:hypothetical protein